MKPRASNQRSSEIYYLGKGYGLSKEYEMIKRIEKKQEVIIILVISFTRNAFRKDKKLMMKIFLISDSLMRSWFRKQKQLFIKCMIKGRHVSNKENSEDNDTIFILVSEEQIKDFK